MSEPGQTLGQRLKAERERRAMSTQKAADEMHLDPWVIEALEAGDYQRIGPAVYAKGHLKKYASILGLTPADIAAGYEAQPQAPPAAAPQKASFAVHSPAPRTTDGPWVQIAALAAVAVVVAGIAWWRPWHPRAGNAPTAAARSETRSAALTADTGEEAASRDAAGVEAAAAEVSGEAAGEPAARVAARSGAQAAPGAAASAEISSKAAVPAASKAPAPAAIPAVLSSKPAGTASDADTLLGAGRARLRLSFSADSWVDVHDAAGRRVYAGNGRANSVTTVAGMAPLKVYLGFASGVQLEINDRAVAIGPQFVAGDVARFDAGADGVLRRDSHAAPANGATVPGAHARPAAPRG